MNGYIKALYPSIGTIFSYNEVMYPYIRTMYPYNAELYGYREVDFAKPSDTFYFLKVMPCR